MGTRSLTVFQREKKDVAVMYRQFDGYLEGHGKELAEFLDGFHICNGWTDADQKRPKVANGIGCLAAQTIAHFKAKYPLGNIYMEPCGERDAGSEYHYFVSADNEALILRVVGDGKTLKGSPAQLLAKINKAKAIA